MCVIDRASFSVHTPRAHLENSSFGACRGHVCLFIVQSARAHVLHMLCLNLHRKLRIRGHEEREYSQGTKERIRTHEIYRAWSVSKRIGTRARTGLRRACAGLSDDLVCRP